MFVKPVLSELRMLDESLCLIVVVSDELLTSRGNTVLVMQRLKIVCSGTVTIIQLVLPPWEIGFSVFDMFYKCHPRKCQRWDWLENVERWLVYDIAS